MARGIAFNNRQLEGSRQDLGALLHGAVAQPTEASWCVLPIMTQEPGGQTRAPRLLCYEGRKMAKQRSKSADGENQKPRKSVSASVELDVVTYMLVSAIAVKKNQSKSQFMAEAIATATKRHNLSALLEAEGSVDPAGEENRSEAA